MAASTGAGWPVRVTSALKIYQFVAKVETQSITMKIDCVNDMDASLIALRLVSRDCSVDVWFDGALIYQAPALAQHPFAHDELPRETCQDLLEVAALTEQSIAI